jgi:hypothetical protein
MILKFLRSNINNSKKLGFNVCQIKVYFKIPGFYERKKKPTKQTKKWFWLCILVQDQIWQGWSEPGDMPTKESRLQSLGTRLLHGVWFLSYIIWVWDFHAFYQHCCFPWLLSHLCLVYMMQHFKNLAWHKDQLCKTSWFQLRFVFFLSHHPFSHSASSCWRCWFTLLQVKHTPLLPLPHSLSPAEILKTLKILYPDLRL